MSNIPEPSRDDEINTCQFQIISNILNFKFLGHMVINPNGYVIDGGTLGEDEESKQTSEIEYLGNGMAATYIFGNRIEGTIKDIKRLVEDDVSGKTEVK